MSNKLFPIVFGRIRDGSGNYAKIFRALIAANVKKAAAMIDIVFMIGLARDNYFPGCIGVIRRDIAELGRRFAEGAQQDHSFVARATDADIEQFVFLFIDQLVLISPQNVTPQFVVTL